MIGYTEILAYKPDVIVAGAGFSGLVAARIFAENGRRVLVLEKRTHLGGNAFDEKDTETGLTVHRYGPHIFHTNNREVFEFLSRFTDWNGYEHKVLANVHKTLLPVPFNLDSLRLAFPEKDAQALERKLLLRYGENTSVSILDLLKTDESDLRALGDYIYRSIFETYTVKQWGKKPEDIDPATTARVPIRLSHDDRYFTDRYQGLPTDGYTALLTRMATHENIRVLTQTDALDVIRLSEADKKLYIGETPFEGIFVYTGVPDVLLDCRFGALPYRSLDFAFETHDVPYFQPCGTVNYTVDMPYTRITEFKHMTLEHAPRTVILKEYSKACDFARGDIPYYPIASPESAAVYAQYAVSLAAYKNLVLVGRLAEYRYYNMDAAAARAMAAAKELLHAPYACL